MPSLVAPAPFPIAPPPALKRPPAAAPSLSQARALAALADFNGAGALEQLPARRRRPPLATVAAPPATKPVAIKPPVAEQPVAPAPAPAPTPQVVVGPDIEFAGDLLVSPPRAPRPRSEAGALPADEIAALFEIGGLAPAEVEAEAEWGQLAQSWSAPSPSPAASRCVSPAPGADVASLLGGELAGLGGLQLSPPDGPRLLSPAPMSGWTPPASPEPSEGLAGLVPELADELLLPSFDLLAECAPEFVADVLADGALTTALPAATTAPLWSRHGFATPPASPPASPGREPVPRAMPAKRKASAAPAPAHGQKPAGAARPAKRARGAVAPAPRPAEQTALRGRTPADTQRLVHNAMERNRRSDLKTSYAALRLEIPGLAADTQAPVAVILRHAIGYTEQLVADERQLDAELAAARAENDKLRRRLIGRA